MISISDQGPPPTCPPSFNMAKHVLARAAELGEKAALVVVTSTNSGTYSYSDLESAVRATATGFLVQGLQPGDRLLMRLGDCVDFPIVFLAALSVDIVPVPTSAALAVPEVAGIIAELSPALIVQGDGVPCPTNTPCPVLSVSDLNRFRACPPADYVMGDPDRLGYIIYTSGTSGKPRAVCHAHRAVWARQMMYQGWEGLGEDDRLLHAGAFNWTYTLGTGLMDPWRVGATALIPASGQTSADLAPLMRCYDASILAAAPGVYRQLLKSAGKLDLPNLRHGLSAGEKLPDATRARWRKATGTLIYEAYGMSECSTFISGAPTRQAPMGASGYAQSGRRVAILNQNGDPVPHNTPGNLAVSRDDPGLMRGYWDAPGETKARFKGKWFVTGDTMSMAKDGAITYLGRADDMMNAGGYRVSPIEVEQVLSRHPDIQEVAAVEVTVKADTTVIAAFYTAKTALDATDLTGYVSKRLARYKVPRIIRHVDALPKGANGKLLRRTLREAYEAKHDPT